jgi:hypothetical protein
MKKLGFFTTKENAVKLILSMYEDEPCRICGKTITDASLAVYAGYSKDNKARSAHKTCWDKDIPVSEWAHQ